MESRGVPHSLQNLASAGLWVPHTGQRIAHPHADKGSKEDQLHTDSILLLGALFLIAIVS